MGNEPNCKCEDTKENKNPEQVYTLLLRDLPDREIMIRVVESRLVSVVNTLSRNFFIEIQ